MLGRELRSEMAVLRSALEAAMAALETRVAKEQRRPFVGVMVPNAGLAGVVLGAAQLF